MAVERTICAATLVLLFAAAAVAFEFDVGSFIPNLNFIGKSKESPARCEKQLQKQQLDCCQVYLRESSKVLSPPTVPPVFMVVDDNQGSTWREAFPSCCEQLEKITKQCRCEAIKQAVQQQLQKGLLQGIEMQEMQQTAQSLPNLCRIKKAQPCNIPIGSF